MILRAVPVLVLVLAINFIGNVSVVQVHATSPGGNGKIAFVSDRDGLRQVYTMNADGSDQTNISNSGYDDGAPAWSPDGQRIAFDRKVNSQFNGQFDIFVMNADGSNQVDVSPYPNAGVSPTWSPDGKRLAFASYRNGSFDIVVMNADGSNQTDITSNTVYFEYAPAWSPDGGRIAMTAMRSDAHGNGVIDVIAMDPDGRNELNLTNMQAPDSAEAPSWSPDGSRLAFLTTTQGDQVFQIVIANRDGSSPHSIFSPQFYATPSWSPDGTKILLDRNDSFLGPQQIWVMNADGSNPTQLTNGSFSNSDPDWQPMIRTALSQDTLLGASTLEVVGTNGFAKGDEIDIDPGGANEEYSVVNALGSLD